MQGAQFDHVTLQKRGNQLVLRAGHNNMRAWSQLNSTQHF